MRTFLSCLLFLLFTTLGAQIPARPDPPKLLNNLSKEFPDFLSAEESQRLENKLETFSNETSNQICIVIVDNLNGNDAASFATQLGTEWGVGKKDKNNGIVILIKPTESDGGRDLFVSVGYGLEGAIPDLMVKRILDDILFPNLKRGENFKALDESTTLLMKLAKGEVNEKDYRPRSKKSVNFKTIVIIIIVLIILIRMFRNGGGGTTFSRGGRHIYWGGGGFGGGSWGGGSWGGGSSSGGGWGGFGGGSFGGGGAGGKW